MTMLLDGQMVAPSSTGSEQPGHGGPPSQRTVVEGPAGTVGAWLWRSTVVDRPKAPVVIALHGWTDGGLVYETLAGGLDRQWTVIAPDAPGHGWTPWAPGRAYCLSEAVDHTLQVIEALDRLIDRPGPFVLLGHSMGALTAAAVAAQKPSGLVHLVLEEPVTKPARRSGMFGRLLAVRGRWLLRTSLAKVQALDRDQRMDWVHRANPDWGAAELGPWADTKVEVDLAQLRVGIDWGLPLTTLLERVKVPVTLICGTRPGGSEVSPRDIQGFRAAYGGQLDVRRIPAGHNVRRDNAADFNAIMRGVLLDAESDPL